MQHVRQVLQRQPERTGQLQLDVDVSEADCDVDCRDRWIDCLAVGLVGVQELQFGAGSLPVDVALPLVGLLRCQADHFAVVGSIAAAGCFHYGK